MSYPFLIGRSFPHSKKFAFQRGVIAGNFRSLQVSQIKN